MHKKNLLLVCAGCWLLATFGSFSDAAEHPNIVIILADDMGHGDPTCNNSASKMTTPNIDRLASEGLRFTDAHSPASWCTPTRYGLLTGRYPFRNELAWRKGPVIDEQRLTLPSMLRQRGYRTVMVGKWHLGFDAPDLSGPHRGGPVDRGFDHYFGIPASLDIPPYYFIDGDRAVAAPDERIGDKNTEGWSPIQGEFWREGGIAPGFRHIDVLPAFAERTASEIQQHKQQHPDRPLFLYLALPAPHTPWVPTPEFQGKSNVSLYGDFVMQVDATVGHVLDALHAADMDRNTLFVFSSDNGPVWYETDEVRFDHKSTGIYRGMKGDAWEGGHRMPLLVRWPAQIKRGRVTQQLACLTDLFATFASLVSFPLPDDVAEDSFDLSPLFLADHARKKPIRETLIVNSTQDFLTVRQGNWKLIPFRGSGGFTKPRVITDVPVGEPKGQLYDLSEDPSESNNLHAQRPEMVTQLSELLQQTLAAGRSR